MTKDEFRKLSNAERINFLNGYLGRTKICDKENEFVWAFAVRNTDCKKVDNKYVQLSAEELEELKKNEKPKTKKVKEKEQETVLSKKNYIILIIGSILIIAGYILMSGEGSTLAAYHPDIFSETRIRIAPLVCLLGYLLNIFGILYRPLK